MMSKVSNDMINSYGHVSGYKPSLLVEMAKEAHERNQQKGRTMKKYALKLKGKNKSWSIPILATEEDVKVWKKDGLEVIEVITDKY